ncbi:MAG: sigma-70 family RNA polymerase sigma factor [Verrucomicrobia bacterium]|nr:sigma-70 family RNA polymerase sigma factor [Verrucomicrobiota bacterium]
MPAEDPTAGSQTQHAIFATTHWSVVVAAGQADSPQAAEALEKLCRAYWYPLYAFVRRRGYGPEDAQDLTQSFFARVLERKDIKHADPQRGRFRTFLLSALSNFLADEWDRAHRLKRGGGQATISFDAVSAEERYRLEPVDRLDAAKLFERRWATTLLERALTRLEQEFRERGQGKLLEALRPFLLGEQAEATYAEIAPRLAMTTAAVKMAASRMRARCRELLREEIQQTVASPQEAEEEYRALVAVLRQ